MTTEQIALTFIRSFTNHISLLSGTRPPQFEVLIAINVFEVSFAFKQCD